MVFGRPESRIFLLCLFSFASYFILFYVMEALVLCMPNCLPDCPIYVGQLFLIFERLIWKDEFD